MPKMVDITNQRFGRLLALKPTELRDHRFYWLCRCDCGKETVVQGKKLRNGHTRSCGCLKDGSRLITHGEAKNGRETPEYSIWKEMRGRCERPSHKNFKDYGGRGITVCERWNDYANFIADVGRRPNPALSIDRIDNDRNYEPGNVRWATKKEQVNNQRRSKRRQTPPSTAALP